LILGVVLDGRIKLMGELTALPPERDS